MTVTAARLGSAPITFDWSNLVNVSPNIAPDAAALGAAWAKLEARFKAGEVGFFYSPKDDALSQLAASVELAEKIRREGRISDVLFLGIGGSALGPVALLHSLEHCAQGGPKFHFVENPDPVDWGLTIAKLKPASTLVCVVTKSGGTFETLSQFMLALEWLGQDRWTSNIVAITDPEKGDLRAFANQNKIPTLSIAPSIGGRFSVFTPVGLFPAALAGLNGKEFLLGAQQVADYVLKTPLEKNPLAVLGHHLIEHFKKRPIHVCMPYSTRLRLVGNWWVQLWGESLGKDGKGFSPIAGVGAIDQHSLLQLLRDGPDDKITSFITVEKSDQPGRIPRVEAKGVQMLGSFTQLQGHTLQELLDVEYRATALVLTKRSRPHFTIRLEKLDERAIGSLLFAFSTLTAITGTLWGINPFDQPGVEEGKVYIRDFLREGRSEKVDADDDNSPVGRLRREPS